MAIEIVEIKFICKEQDWANETTRYWFNVTTTPSLWDGDEYCIADKNGDLTLLDCDGCPIHSEYNPSALGNASDRKIYNALIGLMRLTSRYKERPKVLLSLGIEREKHLND